MKEQLNQEKENQGGEVLLPYNLIMKTESKEPGKQITHLSGNFQNKLTQAQKNISSFPEHNSEQLISLSQTNDSPSQR